MEMVDEVLHDKHLFGFDVVKADCSPTAALETLRNGERHGSSPGEVEAAGVQMILRRMGKEAMSTHRISRVHNLDAAVVQTDGHLHILPTSVAWLAFSPVLSISSRFVLHRSVLNLALPTLRISKRFFRACFEST